MTNVLLAVDLGASSGRHVAGLFDGNRLTLEEVHRFENGPIGAAGRLYWDLLRQWQDVQAGLRIAASNYGERIRSVGIDAWGVDFALLGRGDELLGNPYNYRDHRTDGMIERACSIVPREEIFAQTGLQFIQINTLYQLLAMREQQSPLLDVAQSLLMIPDLFNWLLTGVKANEFTDATTTQFYDPRRRGWAVDLLNRLNLPTHILGEIVAPGTTLGPLRSTVAEATGLSGVNVVLPGTHDTASAVMAAPAASKPGERPDWCYISSGTWSLMGVETPAPIVNDLCLSLNFTNEGGVGGTTRVLKNIVGLWLVQECRRHWGQEGITYSWDHLTREAAEAQPLAAFVDVDHPSFLAPGDMPAAIRAYCEKTRQPAPESVGAIIRCALESLAMRYRRALAALEQLVGGRIDTIHIIGGGAQNRQLCQMTASACRRRVVAGPVEATAIGNLMMQAIAAGLVGSIAEARQAIRNSFSVDQYMPEHADEWDAAFERYQKITG